MISINNWLLSTTSEVNDFTESIFFIGNGEIGIRGFSSQEEKTTDYSHAIFKAGLYENIKKNICDMVQLPDFMHLSVKNEAYKITSQSLNMLEGIFVQNWVSDNFVCETQRIASMADKQLVCIKLKLSAKTDSSYEICDSLNTRVSNLPVNDDQMTKDTETVVLIKTVKEKPNYYKFETLHSNTPITISWQTIGNLSGTLKAGESIVVEKQIRLLVGDEAPNPKNENPWESHSLAWQKLWNDCDIAIDGSEELQGAIRYNIFQLICNNASENPNASIGARGLSHGRYKGNTFWDTDIFLMPFYTWQRPNAAKNLSLFRVNRLDAARALAKKKSLKGARFPWMCSTSGEEQCESWDIGACEIHITADVAYGIDKYNSIANEPIDAGELYQQTAEYWLSRFSYEHAKDKYSLFFVKGPDEYCGITVNNTFTNYMARHNVNLALKYSKLTAEQRSTYENFRDKITILYDEQRDLFLQDELFERLEPYKIENINDEPAYKSIDYDRIQRLKVLKQADLVQLATLFPNEISLKQKQNIFNFYEPLTLHDSSLSYGVHALLAFQIGENKKAWDYFEKSLYLDLKNVMNNVGNEGLHVAAFGISWQAIVYGIAGLNLVDNKLTINPNLPKQIKNINFAVYHKGKKYRINIGENNSIKEEE